MEGLNNGLHTGPLWARRIQAAGGVLCYVAMDEPFFYGSLYDGPRACHGSPTANPPTTAGMLQVTGSLTDIAGNPISNAPVELSVTPLSGPGVFAEYTISGTVPAGVTQANIGFRVNDECGCSGTSEFFLYEARYVQGNETRNRVANGNFSQGLQDWGFWGTGTARIERSDRGPGNMLHVQATPAQSASINSAPFPVTAGATYTLTFAARVSPVSVGSGYFAVFLLKPSGEGQRDMIPLEPAAIRDTTSTDGRGTYRFTVQGVPSARLKLRVKYSGIEFPGSVGDEGYWPAYAEQVIEQPVSVLHLADRAFHSRTSRLRTRM